MLCYTKEIDVNWFRKSLQKMTLVCDVYFSDVIKNRFIKYT